MLDTQHADWNSVRIISHTLPTTWYWLPDIFLRSNKIWGFGSSVRSSACPNVCIPPTPPIFEQMFSTTVKSKWSVCVAFAFSREMLCSLCFTRLGDKQVLCKISGRASKQVRACPSIPVKGYTLCRGRDSPFGLFFDVTACERLDRAQVKDCVASLMI